MQNVHSGLTLLAGATGNIHFLHFESYIVLLLTRIRNGLYPRTLTIID